MDTETESKGIGGESDLNGLVTAEYVQCEGFRCLAYRDEEGMWRYFFGKQLIRGKVTLPRV